MADATAAQAVRDAEARLQEQQLDFDKTEFYYRAHVKSVVDVYNSENKEVPAELREQADRATHNIQEAKKKLASRRDDLRIARIRQCAERARHDMETPEANERDADPSPAENRKRGPPDGLLPRIAKRLQTNHGPSSQPEPGRTAALLALLMDGTLAPGPNYPGNGVCDQPKQEINNAYFEFDDENFYMADEEENEDLFDDTRLLLFQAPPKMLLPDQIYNFWNNPTGDASEFMSLLTQFAYRLRIDSRVFGSVATSIYNGSASPGEMDDLKVAVCNTYSDGKLGRLFLTEYTEDSEVWFNHLLGYLVSPDSEVVEATACTLLLTATFLAKYVCLVTSVTVALATSFTPKGELAKDAVRPSAITEALEHHKELLPRFLEVKEHSPYISDDTYNSNHEVGRYLNRIEFHRRLGPLVPHLPDLVTFLSSQDYE